MVESAGRGILGEKTCSRSAIFVSGHHIAPMWITYGVAGAIETVGIIARAFEERNLFAPYSIRTVYS